MEEFSSFEFDLTTAYGRSFKLVFMPKMLMLNTSLSFFVLSFVLLCACVYIASEDQALLFI